MSIGGTFHFSDLKRLTLQNPNMFKGCVVDTSILFALSYPNDSHNDSADQIFEYLQELKIPTFTNVNIRAEFLNLCFQVIVPEGLADLQSNHADNLFSQVLDKKLKSHYVLIHEARKTGISYKMSTKKIEEWKKLLRDNVYSSDGWYQFCHDYIGSRIETTWDDTCKVAGINFLSLRSGETQDWKTGPIDWSDVTHIIGQYGIGSFDAMIINLFLNSHFDFLITADSEIARVVRDLSNTKIVLCPDNKKVLSY